MTTIFNSYSAVRDEPFYRYCCFSNILPIHTSSIAPYSMTGYKVIQIDMVMRLSKNFPAWNSYSQRSYRSNYPSEVSVQFFRTSTPKLNIAVPTPCCMAHHTSTLANQEIVSATQGSQNSPWRVALCRATHNSLISWTPGACRILPGFARMPVSDFELMAGSLTTPQVMKKPASAKYRFTNSRLLAWFIHKATSKC